MAYTLSENSKDKLKGVHPKLALVFTEAIKTSPIDFTILEGKRTTERQIDLFRNGHSKCDGMKKKSNHQPKADGLGYAVDAAPYPIDWNDKKRFKILSNHIKATAKKLGMKIVWGGDWVSFCDMPHYELVYNK